MHDSRAALARWSYWLHNPQITVETYYRPLLSQAISAMGGQTLYLSLDTSQLWQGYWLSMVALCWGGRAIPVCWQVRETTSASIAFKDVAFGIMDPTSVKAIDPGAGQVRGVCQLGLRQTGGVFCNLVVGTPKGSRQ